MATYTARVYVSNSELGYFLSGGSSYTDRTVSSTSDAAFGGVAPKTKNGSSYDGYTIISGSSSSITGVNGNNFIVHATASTGSVEIRLNFSASYTVTLDRQSGSGGTSSVTATYGSAMPSITPPTRTGYTFGGYYTAANGGGTQYYTASGASAANWNVASNATLYAKWTANTYTVEFSTGGSQQVTYGLPMPGITPPALAGYTFGGFFTAANGKGVQYYTSFGTSARNYDRTQSIYLHANWIVNQYTVTLDRQSGSGGTSSVTATYGSAMPSITPPTRTGYTFGGYYTAANGGGTQYYTASGASAANWNVASNTTLYAKWTAREYALKVNPNGGTYKGSTSVYTQPEKLRTGASTYRGIGSGAAGAVRTGYTLIGYYDALTGTNRVYDANGQAVNGKYWDGNYDAPARFKGFADTSVTSLTVYARWTVNQYTVTLDRQSGSGGTSSVTATYGSAMPSITPPTRTGYTFGGYYTAANGGGTQYYTASGASARAWGVATNTTLYAKWVRIVNISLSSSCTESSVQFPVGGVSPIVQIGAGQTGASVTGSQEEGRTVTLRAVATARPDGSQKGLTFSHFSVLYGGQTIVDQSSVVATDGNWKEVSFVVPSGVRTGGISAIAYYSRDEVVATASLGSASAADGIAQTNVSVSPADVTRHFGDTATFSATTPSGYAFYGWCEADNPLDGSLAPSSSVDVELTGDITLYAHYARSVAFEVVSLDQEEAETSGGGTVDVSFGTGESAQDPSSPFLVPIGAAIRFVATASDGFYFTGMTFTPSGESPSPTRYGADDTFVPDGSGTYTVVFQEAPPDVYLACLDMIEVTDPPTTGNVGTTTASYEGSDNAFSQVEVGDVPDDVKDNFASAASATWYKARKGISVTLSVEKAVSGVVLEWKSTEDRQLPLQAASLMGATPPDEASGEAWSTMKFLVNDNTLVVTQWGLYANPKVKLVPSAGGRAVFVGVAQVDGQDVHEKYFPVTDGEYQTATVRAIPDPSGGYVFVGWFRNGQLVTTEADYSFTVTADTELVAQFARDDNAVFAWEGGTSNKVMEWTSGVMTVPRPQDPVAIRVDAVRYPVSASVQTRSSPDSEDDRVHAVNVNGQAARRLPRLRPERFWQVSLVSDAEIDAVVVATNIVEAN